MNFQFDVCQDTLRDMQAASRAVIGISINSPLRPRYEVGEGGRTDGRGSAFEAS